MKFLLIIFSLIVNMNAYADSNWVYISTSNTNDVFLLIKIQFKQMVIQKHIGNKLTMEKEISLEI